MMQYFTQAHYDAFLEPKPNLDDMPTRSERLRVREALLQLDSALWPYILQKQTTDGWDLHHHRQQEHYTSSYHFIPSDDGRMIVDHIDAMWLHYGKSPKQLDMYNYGRLNGDPEYNAYYRHTRIQFFINHTCFRAWLLFTDRNLYDQKEYLKKLRNPAYQQKVQQTIAPMISSASSNPFFYEINGTRMYLSPPTTPQQIVEYMRTDRGNVYAGCVKEYQPNDPMLHPNNIVNEMKKNLDALYPLYNLMAHRS